jgi:hypothetical protein
MKLYISEGAVWLLLVFYMPLVLLALWILWSKLPRQLPIRLLGIFIAATLAIAIPLGDVFSTSVEMAKLCPKTGIFVNRTVQVNGFLTKYGSPDMLDQGFDYVESQGVADRVTVYRKNGKGVAKEEFSASEYQIRSQYEYVPNAVNGSFEGRRDIGIQKSVVRDRSTGEELGYSLRFAAYPGWLDRTTVAQFGQLGWPCHAYVDQEIRMRKQTLVPLAGNKENKP